MLKIFTAVTLYSLQRRKGILVLSNCFCNLTKYAKKVRDEDGRTPLLCTVQAGSSAAVRMLLGRHDIDVTSGDNYGLTPFACALWTKNRELIQIFLDSDRAPDVCNAEDNRGNTPLSVLIQTYNSWGIWKMGWARLTCILYPKKEKEDSEHIGLLLHHKDIDVNRPNIHGITPLMAACQCGQNNTVRLFLGSHKVDVDRKSRDGSTALHYLIPYRGGNVLDQLLAASIDLDSPDKDGTTPFMKAAFYGDHRTFQALLATRKIDFNRKDICGRTALFLAIQNGQLAMVEALFDIPGRCRNTGSCWTDAAHVCCSVS